MQLVVNAISDLFQSSMGIILPQDQIKVLVTLCIVLLGSWIITTHWQPFNFRQFSLALRLTEEQMRKGQHYIHIYDVQILLLEMPCSFVGPSVTFFTPI